MKNYRTEIEKILETTHLTCTLPDSEKSDWSDYNVVSNLTALVTTAQKETVQEFMEYCWDGGEHDSWLIAKADGFLNTLAQEGGTK
jgi:hypothetical protein